MMVLGKVSKFAFMALAGALAVAFLKDAFTGSRGVGEAFASVGAGGQQIGGALSSVGSGVQGLFTGIGTGTAQLLNPLFTAKELIYGGQNILQGGATGDNQQGASPVPTSFNPPVDPVPDQPLTKTFSSGASLTVSNFFKSLGSGDFTGVRGQPLPSNAIARTQDTFSGVLSTPTGGTRTIRGSAALFQRLNNNLGGING